MLPIIRVRYDLRVNKSREDPGPSIRMNMNGSKVTSRVEVVGYQHRRLGNMEMMVQLLGPVSLVG